MTSEQTSDRPVLNWTVFSSGLVVGLLVGVILGLLLAFQYLSAATVQSGLGQVSATLR